MDISSIVQLVRDYSNQDGLYNMYIIDYNESISFTLTPFTVRSEHEMRMDLILKEMYNSTSISSKHIDFICNINDIDNPLNVLEGDILFYAPIEMLEQTKMDTSVSNTSSSPSNPSLINRNKLKTTDNNRKEYVENNFSLNPNYATSGQPSVTYNQNKVTIRRN